MLFFLWSNMLLNLYFLFFLCMESFKFLLSFFLRSHNAKFSHSMMWLSRKIVIRKFPSIFLRNWYVRNWEIVSFNMNRENAKFLRREHCKVHIRPLFFLLSEIKDHIPPIVIHRQPCLFHLLFQMRILEIVRSEGQVITWLNNWVILSIKEHSRTLN